MTKTNKYSTDEPFKNPEIIKSAYKALIKAESMGLVELVPSKTLSRDSVLKYLLKISKAGIGRQVALQLQARVPEQSDPSYLTDLFDKLNDALEDSPVPESEWHSMEKVLGAEFLAKIIGIAEVSLKRYRAGQRSTPEKIGARLHFLALLTGDLAGAYNDMGIRRWFQRPRTQLDGSTPMSFLAGDWDPADSGPVKIRDLARAATSFSVT